MAQRSYSKHAIFGIESVSTHPAFIVAGDRCSSHVLCCVRRVYARPSKSAKLPTGAPLQNLIGFTKVEISKGDAKTVDVTVDSTQLETAMPDGTRVLVHGE